MNALPNPAPWLDSRLADIERRWQPYASSRHRLLRGGYRVGHALWRPATVLLRFCASPDFRAIVYLRLFSSRALHQTTVMTWMNRYPRLFAACQRHFDGRSELRLLSYGCATGEEVLTLRHYFPSASIVGAEINKRSLARCRALAVDDRIRFVFSDHALIAQHGPYDAIFCMAVLQRGPHEVQRTGVTNLSRIYPFEKFDTEVGKLDALLKPEGLLVIHHAQYDLSDTSVAAKYEALEVGPPDGRPRFDRHGDLKPAAAHLASIFVKRRG